MEHTSSNGALLLSILAAVLSTAVHAATNGTTCGPTFNFFPAGKNSSIPTAWTQSAQQQAGNTRKDLLYTVALTSTRNVAGIDAEPTVPELTVVPVHDLLVVGSNPSPACRGIGVKSTSSISFAELVGSRIADELVGSSPADGLVGSSPADGLVGSSIADELVNGSIADGQFIGAAQRRLLQGSVTDAARFRVEYKFNGSSWASLGEYEKTLPAPRIVLSELEGVADGYYCITIRLTIIAGSGLIGSTAVPLEDLWSTTQVCFLKVDVLPTANVTHTSCGAPFSLNVTDMQPGPVPLFPGSSELMFNPVYRLQLTYNRSKDGSWPSEDPGRHDKWIILETAAAIKQPYRFLPDNQLTDGYWNVKLESSLMTSYPSLMSLGIAGIEQYGEEDMPEQLQGKYKMAKNNLFPKGKLVGIQNTYTKFVLFDGPELEKIPVNSELSFNWEWDGFGRQLCFFDGLKYYNAEDFTCQPPLGFKLPDSRNNTLTVILQDVCGKNFTFEVAYGTWGYKMTKIPVNTAAKPDTDLDYGAGPDFDSVSLITGDSGLRRPSTQNDARHIHTNRLLLSLTAFVVFSSVGILNSVN